MVQTTNLGYPRIGRQRELKKALESFWAGTLSEEALQEQARNLRRTHWLLQQRLGIQQIPSNDFSFYDHVLDTMALGLCCKNIVEEALSVTTALLTPLKRDGFPPLVSISFG